MRPVPLFYYPFILSAENELSLTNEEATHALKVLRLRTGDEISIVNGKGQKLDGHIAEAGKKNCTIKPEILHAEEADPAAIHIALAALKKKDRLEWFVEKAVELNAASVTIFQSAHTEKGRYDAGRLEKIAVSALKQSGNLWLPEIHTGESFSEVLNRYPAGDGQRFIAHCRTGEEQLLKHAYTPGTSSYIFIGPEGDFSEEEVDEALAAGYEAVNLGKLRLRAETAAMAALLTCKVINY